MHVDRAVPASRTASPRPGTTANTDTSGQGTNLLQGVGPSVPAALGERDGVPVEHRSRPGRSPRGLVSPWPSPSSSPSWEVTTANGEVARNPATAGAASAPPPDV
ncbi:hypothetical protein [Pseudonocardia alni]|uniref:hypothetical protein n=1 Tax=Pseudonocardia alni TaxID=33907 RepID=UPI000C2BC7C0|nr:hypothetical protein [Pseudonocardia alni]